MLSFHFLAHSVCGLSQTLAHFIDLDFWQKSFYRPLPRVGWVKIFKHELLSTRKGAFCIKDVF